MLCTSCAAAAVNYPVYDGIIGNAAYLERSLSDNIKINPAYRPTGSGSSYYKVEPSGNTPAQMGMDYSNLSGSTDYEPVSPITSEAEVNSAEEMTLKLAEQHFETEHTNGNEYEEIPL